MKKKFLAVCKLISLGIFIQAICFSYCPAQCLSHQQFWNKLLSIENAEDDPGKKLAALTVLKKQYENCGFEKDSVYARMLHKIGVFQSADQHDEAVKNTLESIKINTSGKPGACPSFTASSFSNLGYYHMEGLKYNKAILYFDSSIMIGNRYAGNYLYIVTARIARGNIYYRKGNYEKAIEETNLGLPYAIKLKDTARIVALLLERAQSYIQQQKPEFALNDINQSLSLLKNIEAYDSWANALRYKADIIAEQNNCAEAFNLFKQSIVYRKKVDQWQTAVDYNDAGYILYKKCSNYELAKNYFDTAYKLGSQLDYDFPCTLAMYNLAEISFEKKDYKKALLQNQKSLQHLLPRYHIKNQLVNPPHKEFLNIDSKSTAEIVLSNKTKYLLYLYKQTNNVQFLKASITTSELNDSVITDLRHEQTGEQTKLYWRNDTRDFFSNAIEACYLDNNAEQAFYFMEKSRAVLLNDKLNELGAERQLPATEITELETLQENIAIEQQELSQLNDATTAYAEQQNRFLNTREALEHYITSLEQKYPAYFQYKYADKVPALKELQRYLSKHKQSFVHYFLADTVSYILAITSTGTKFIRLRQNEINREQLAGFLQLFTNKQQLNNNYDSFAVLSNLIYKKIFQPLQLPKGRVVICSDNIVLPFDALCTDKAGKKFLLNDYSFSYVYSARFLMNEFNNPVASGNFIGFAPVSYATYLDVNDLKNAALALRASGKFYKNERLLTHEKASKHNFFNYISSYSIVNVFSHASADTTGSEPVLYMQDSVIRLSDLQLLKNPATQLILLSACQTNVGKVATGEGIYSLARGFTTAGIPSVTATLWKADEQAIYSITEKFNKYLSEGITKDEALRKAKLDYIEHNSLEKMLPYYWANIIVVGSTDAINLTTSNNNNMPWWTFIAIIGIIILIFSYYKYRKNINNK